MNQPKMSYKISNKDKLWTPSNKPVPKRLRETPQQIEAEQNAFAKPEYRTYKYNPKPKDKLKNYYYSYDGAKVQVRARTEKEADKIAIEKGYIEGTL